MGATKAAQDKWFAGAVGRPMNPDKAFGLQCKDVGDDYTDTLWGVGSWIKILKPENAKDAFARADPNYFTKVPNDPHNPTQIPPHGSIIIYGASRAVPEGHMAVVDSSDVNGVNVIQQDGYVQYPAKRVRLPYVLPNGANVIGWLIPKLEAPKKNATQAEIQKAYMDILERPADATGIKHYLLYTIDFVRADLKTSQEYRNLQANKAAAAKAAADAAAKKAALQAEAQRVAEEQAAAERLKEQAEAQAKAAQQAADALQNEPPVVAPAAESAGTVVLETQPTQPSPDPAPMMPTLSMWQQFLLWFNENVLQPHANKNKD